MELKVVEQKVIELKGKKVVFDGIVHFTKDYDSLKFAEWNRTVSKKQIDTIKTSLNSVGFLPIPGVVNEKNEIIEGQGRFLVCKELGLEYPYIVVPGLGREECIALNNYSTDWETITYIESYAKEGLLPYIWFKDLVDRYFSDKTIGLTVIDAALEDNVGGMTSAARQRILNGSFSVTEEDYKNADNKLDFLSRFSETWTKKPANKGLLQRCLLIAYADPDCDNNFLIKRMNKCDRVTGYNNVPDCLEIIEKIYNARRPVEKQIDLRHFHKFKMASTRPGHSARWGNKY